MLLLKHIILALFFQQWILICKLKQQKKNLTATYMLGLLLGGWCLLSGVITCTGFLAGLSKGPTCATCCPELTTGLLCMGSWFCKASTWEFVTLIGCIRIMRMTWSDSGVGKLWTIELPIPIASVILYSILVCALRSLVILSVGPCHNLWWLIRLVHVVRLWVTSSPLCGYVLWHLIRLCHIPSSIRGHALWWCILLSVSGHGNGCPLFEAMLCGCCLLSGVITCTGFLDGLVVRILHDWACVRSSGYGCPLSEAMLCGDMYGCPCGDWCDCDCHQSTGLYHWHIDHVDSKPIIHTKSCWLWAVAAPGDPPVGVCQPPGWLLGLATGPDTLNPGLILWGCLYGWGCPYGWFTGLALTSEEPGCEYCKGLSQSQIIANKYIQNMTKANICTQMKI